jgi:hypothetical protein
MATTETTFQVEPGSELDRLLEQANGAPLVLVRGGVRFRVERESDPTDIWAGYDPEKVLQAFQEAAGAWRNIDTEALKADIRAQRGQDSIGRPDEWGSRPAPERAADGVEPAHSNHSNHSDSNPGKGSQSCR